MSRLISRDPFARQELHRKQAPHYAVCDNCGMCRVTRRGVPYTYRYGMYRDGIRTRIEWDSKTFCSIECRRSYFG